MPRFSNESKIAKKPIMTVLDLFTLKEEMARGDRSKNPAYISLLKDIDSVINTIEKLAHEEFKGESSNMEEFYNITRDKIILCNHKIIELLTKLKKKYEDPTISIAKEDKLLIEKTFDYVIDHAKIRIEKSNPFKSSLAIFFKDRVGDSKYIHCQDKDLLLTGGVQADKDAPPDFGNFPGGGLCAGLALFQIDQDSQKKVNFIPVNSASLMNGHLHQQDRMKHIPQKNPKIPLRKLKDGPMSGYILANRIIENLDPNYIYLIELKGHHSMMVRMLPENSTGYKYEFCDPGLHIGYHKTQDELIGNIATCYDLISGGLNYVCTNINMIAFSKNAKELPTELISFLVNQQKQNNVTLANIYDLFTNKEGMLRLLTYRVIVTDSTPLVVATTVLNLFLRARELFLSKSAMSLYFADNIDTDHYYKSMIDFLLTQFEVIKNHKEDDKYKALKSPELEEQLMSFCFKVGAIHEFEDKLSGIASRLEALVIKNESDSSKPSEWEQLIEVFRQTKDIELLNQHLSMLISQFGPQKLFKDIQSLYEQFTSYIVNKKALEMPLLIKELEAHKNITHKL